MPHATYTHLPICMRWHMHPARGEHHHTNKMHLLDVNMWVHAERNGMQGPQTGEIMEISGRPVTGLEEFVGQQSAC